MRLKLSISYYSKQVYKGYGHLYQASREIFWEQLFLDPIQDTAIESSFEKMIQAGHSADEIKLSKCCSGGFIQHFIPHLAQKTLATIAFPLIYPFLNGTSNIPGKSIITESAAFFGVNPLEGLYSLDTLPKTLLGEDNIISNGAKYLAFREDYHQARAKDEDFNQYMKAYKGYMEFCDSLMHAKTELKTLFNNKDLSTMPYKAYAYFKLKFYLYSNTMAEEAENDKKIENCKLSLQKETVPNTEICFANETISIYEQFSQYETCPAVKQISWTGWLYENKWKIAEEIAIPLIFKKLYAGVISYLPKTTPKDTAEEGDDSETFSPQEDPDGQLPYSPMFWGFDKQSLIFALIRRQTDDQILEEASNIIAVRSGVSSSILYEDTAVDNFDESSSSVAAAAQGSSSDDEEDEEVANFYEHASVIVAAEGSLSDYDDDLPYAGNGFVTPQQPEDSLPIAKLSPSRSRSYSSEGYKTPLGPTPLFFPIIDVIHEEDNFLPLQADDLDDESMNEASLIDDHHQQAALPAAGIFCGDLSSIMPYLKIAGKVATGQCIDPDCNEMH